MPSTWRIDVHLGDGEAAPVIRSRVVEAESEAEALAMVADEVRREPPQLIEDGQEEVSSRGEFQPGAEMNPADWMSHT